MWTNFPRPEQTFAVTAHCTDWDLSEVRRAGGEDDSVGVDGLSSRLAAQRAVHEALVVQEVLEA